MCTRLSVLSWVWAWCLATGSPALVLAENHDQDQRKLFETRIRPVLVERCFQCHSQRSDPPKGNLRLDSPAGWRRGGDTGPAVVEGQPEESLLISALEYESFKMPPDGRLPAAVVADFRAWIEAGALVPAGFGAQVPAAAVATEIDWDTARDFWAFQPLANGVPPAADIPPQGNGIDYYLEEHRRLASVSAAAPADRRQLIRRLSFGLLGLPPTRQQISEFLHDQEPQAYQRLVERLLATPQYGEHWGRKWLDVVRYADSNGADENKPYPLAFHYRNYVIDAFNQDRPFDEFLREQVAGDLLPDEGDLALRNQHITATAFLALGIKIAAEQDQEKKRADIIDEQIDVISRAMFGLTVACARCHDHKFDPIPTADYYALAGVLRSTTLGTRALTDPRQAGLNAELATLEERLETIRSRAEERIARAARDSLEAYLLHSRGVVQWRENGQTSRMRGALSGALTGPYLAVGEFHNPANQGTQRLAGQAEAFARGNAQADHDTYGKGIGIISDAGPGQRVWVEYDVDVPAPGTYQVEFRYAAAAERPGRLLINGRLVNERSMGQTTGSWLPDTQRWFVEGRYPFRGGRNVLRFEVDGVMSHLDQWLLARVDPSPLPAMEAENFVRGNVKPFNADETTYISDPPTGEDLYYVEYDVVTEVRGAHTLMVRYAAAESRPMTLVIDGDTLTDKAVAGVTGGWGVESQRWHLEATATLEPGRHIIRFERSGAVSHIDQWALLRPAKQRAGTDEPEALAKRFQLDYGALEQWTDFLQGAALSDPFFALWSWIGQPDVPWVERLQRWQSTGRPSEDLARWLTIEEPNSDRALVARMAGVLREVTGEEPVVDWKRQVKRLLEGPQGPWRPRRRPASQYSTTNREAAEQLQEEVATLRDALAKLPKIEVMAASEGEPGDQPIFIRGNHLQHGPPVARRFLSVIDGLQQEAYPETQSGRLQLATSITRRGNPLTARVLANRVWRWHFGRALVASTENFGHSGEVPTHPRLLDHLAAKLIEFRWSLKALQRYVVQSNAYRMSSRYDPGNAGRDPGNKWYWRRQPQRLPAEAIRDALLSVSGRLDLAVGGAAVAGVKSQDPSPADLRKNRAVYEGSLRRSIYLPIVRTNVYKFFTLFDFPNPAAPTGNRSTTTIPTQALFLMNNPWVQGVADDIAEQVCLAHQQPELRCEVLFETLFGRLPADDELQDALSLVVQEQPAGQDAADTLAGWKTLVHTLLLSSEFIYVH
ncbi:MAG: hypothetical protein CMJ75_14930 [Planctomycetaceae bacterium]|nr:hypothetical protein [Planctomycetaceae bacterium]